MILPLVALLGAAPAAAFERITDPAEFAVMVTGHTLTRLGISLVVRQDGAITGQGLGRAVSGEWQWTDGYFCRTLDWGGRDLGHNCQAVLHDAGRVRFVSDRGAGPHADFRVN